MSNRRWIELPRVEGETSRQAHADLPDGTFEREIGRDGFFGPASHLYHAHAPTGWSAFEGPLRPRAFDAKTPDETPSPFDAPSLLGNAHVRCASGRAGGHAATRAMPMGMSFCSSMRRGRSVL